MKRDEVREVLSRTLVWLGDHFRQILIGLGVLAVLVLGGTLLASRAGGRQDAASDALAEAIDTRSAPLAAEVSAGVAESVDVYQTADARSAEARRRFEAIATDWPRSASARIARAYLAMLDYEAGQPDAARQAWDELVSSGAEDLLTTQAMLNILALDRQQGNEAEIETRLLGLLDNSASPLPQDRVLYELGMIQRDLGKAAESEASFERLVEEHPTSPLSRSAAARLVEADNAA